MAVTRAAMWRCEATQTIADPGPGRLRFNTADPATVTTVAIAAASADNQDVSDWIQSLTIGSRISLQVQHDAATHADYVLDTAPVSHTTWWQLAVHSVDVHDSTAQLVIQDQAIVLVYLDTTSADAVFTVGDLAYVAAPYQLVAGGNIAVVVATGTGGTLLLFEDGTAGWFTAADLVAFQVAKVGHQARYATYEYDSDLDLHEDWRGGYFERVWQ